MFPIVRAWRTRKLLCQSSAVARHLAEALRSGSEVRFGAVGSQSDVFQSQVVVHRVSQFLFASQIMLGRLNGRMAKQELNLFKFSPS